MTPARRRELLILVELAERVYALGEELADRVLADDPNAFDILVEKKRAEAAYARAKSLISNPTYEEALALEEGRR